MPCTFGCAHMGLVVVLAEPLLSLIAANHVSRRRVSPHESQKT